MSRPRLSWTAAAISVGVICAAFYAMLSTSMSGSTAYPEMASYRTDTMGTKALFTALADAGITTERNLLRLERLRPGPGDTILRFGVEPSDVSSSPERNYAAIPDKSWYTLLKAVRNGARLVAVMEPRNTGPDWDSTATAMGKLPPNPQVLFGNTNSSPTTTSILAEWKSEVERNHLPERQTTPSATPLGLGVFHADKLLPAKKDHVRNSYDYGDYYWSNWQRRARADHAEVDYHEFRGQTTWTTSLLFGRLSPEWTVIARRDGRPVAIERPFGKGSVVLWGDGFVFSNEALRYCRQTELLLSLIGTPKRVIFDDAHLGVIAEEGVMVLVSRYRLHGFLYGFGFLALLYLWRAMAQSPPVRAPMEGKDVTSSANASLGLERLLRRTIEPARLLRACYEEWERSLPRRQRPAGPDGWKAAEISDLVDRETNRPKSSHHVVDAFRAIQQSLNEKRNP